MSRVKNWRFVAAVALVLVLLAGFFVWKKEGAHGRDEAWARVHETGTLRVGIDPEFPPFEGRSPDGKIAGFDVDLAREIASTMGVTATFQIISFDGLLDAVWTGKVDAVISAMPADALYTQDQSYSTPYFDAGTYIVVRKNGAGIRKIGDLAGKKVAVELGSAGDAIIRRSMTRVQGIRLILKEDQKSALQALVSGEADAAIADGVEARTFKGPICLVNPPLESVPYVIVLPKKSPKLLAEVNHALESLKESGKLGELYRKWIVPAGEDPERSCPRP
jgi:ABC-type amino acid transport substrate-binding protein